MADKILKQNKIPGCDRLTRPEEIAALSRYLKNIREIREENTVLDETNLEIPGVTTGQLVDIKELPDGYDKLDVKPKVTDLPEDSVKLDKGNDNISLEDHIENLEDNRKIALSDYRDNLEDNRNTELSTFRDDLEDNREVKLSEFRDDIEDNRTPKLSDYKENLEDSRDIDLSNYKEGLEDNREPELSNYKENLEDNREPELSNYKESLEDSRDIDLSNYKETIEDSRDIDLSDYRDDLVDDKEPELSNYRENITDDRNLELNKYKETIKDDRKLELNKKKSGLAGYEKDVELSNYKDTIVNEKEPSLSDYREGLVGDVDKVESLYDSALGLYDDREPELENFRDDLVDNRENGLEDYVDPIANSDELDKVDSLYDSALGLVDDRENQLEDYRDDLVDDRENRLEDYRDDLEDNRIPELEDYVDPMAGEVHEVESLYDTIIGLETNYYDEETGTPLTDGEARIDGEYDYGNLEAHKHTRIDLGPTSDGDARDFGEYNYFDPQNDDSALSDVIIDRPDFISPEARVDDQYDYFNNDIPYDESDGINPLEMKARGKFAAHRKIVDLPETSEGDARVDNDYSYYDNNSNTFNAEGPQPIDEYKDLINLPESSEGDARVDSDYRYLNQYSSMTDEDLYNYLIDAIKRPDFMSSEARVDDEYDYFDNTINYNEEDGINPLEMKAKAKFKNHQKRLQPNASPDNGGYDPENLSNWDQKLEALVSAYLSRDAISPNNAHRFQAELDRMITVLNHVTNEYEEITYSDVAGGSDGTARIDGDYDFLDNNSKNQTVDEAIFKKHTGKKVLLGKPKQKLEDYSESDINSNTDLVDFAPIASSNRGPYNFIDLRDRDAREFGYERSELLEEQKVPKYILPEETTRSLITYIRSKAEEKVGELPNGSDRRYLIEEALWTLIVARRLSENAIGSYRSKLPGVGTQVGKRISEFVRGEGEGIRGLFQDAGEATIGAFLNEKPLPINRPMGITETFTQATIKKPTTFFTKANSRVEKKLNEGDNGGKFKDFLSSIGLNRVNQWLENLGGVKELYGNYPFATNYLMGTGIATTLSDLCDGKQPSQISSVEDLMDTLKKSAYITTPSKFGTVERGSYGTQTLDNNSYWEVVIEPLCTKDLNGGYSFLPAFQEINLINYIEHGVKTGYNKWVPISNFELQKSKLTTKTVGLYDGEITMPVSTEFTNELRLTVVDDQYKSWRRYFQTCMDVSVYNSEAHNCRYYKDSSKETPTIIDKSNICIAFYKNITFSIKIYVLTPQFSTIKKYSLLCVLKDFAEEYSGDIDAGGIDLSVSFSIVGEMSENFENYDNTSQPSTQTSIQELTPRPTPQGINVNTGGFNGLNSMGIYYA